jgi:DNA-directed RNA polymerase I, II, and III subunit RPABC1
MNFEDLDILYRSRITLLKILKDNGYNTTKYERFGPWEIEAMVSAGQESLRMELKRDPQPDSPLTECVVLYSLQKLKQKLGSFVPSIISELNTANKLKTTEVVVIVLEDVADVFHASALNTLIGEKCHIRFFKAHNLIFDPRDHVLVPPHTKVPASEHAEFLKQRYISSKANLPIIRFHEDMIARIMGLVPGDIVKITRPSPSAGIYEVYRVCMP